MVRHVSVPERWDIEADLVAVGSSTGGLVSAITGHDLGLSTVLLEKTDFLGGGTALSGGALWIPCNHHMLAMGLSDSREEALTYIRRMSLGRHDEEHLGAYIENGPKMLRYVEEATPLKMAVDQTIADYYADFPGGKGIGRILVPDTGRLTPLLTEAEKSHPLIGKIRHEPVPRFFGMREPPWFPGRMLVGGLALGCINRQINILTSTRAMQLIVDNGRVIGLRAQRDGRDFFIKCRKGIVIATGGSEWNEEMNKRFINSPPLHGITPPSNEGDGHMMGMEIGAAVALMDHSIFNPVIRIPGEETEGRPYWRMFMYSIGHPGTILVNRHGKRCCDEAFYPAVGEAFCAYDRLRGEFRNTPLFWIADQSYRDRFVVGPLKKGTEMADWLHRADTLPELAAQLGLPADSLVKTVERFNALAREERDPDFHRGESSYDVRWGLNYFPDHKPPTLGPLEKPPFYGVQIHMGTVGNLGGLVTNSNAQVIDTRGKIIPGLYGTSNATALLCAGFCYQSGMSHTKSMIFGYLAARHMAGADG